MRIRPAQTGVPERLAGLLLTAALTACSLAPTYQRPARPVPSQWRDGMSGAAPATASAIPVADLEWRIFVADPALGRLVDLALAHNRSLRQTLLDVDVARAQYRVQRADRLPSLQIDASGSRQRTPEAAAVQNSYQAGIGLAAFELDLFGRVRNLSEAGLQEYLATEEAASSARISLVAEVIQAYLTRDGAQHRYLLATQTLETREASLKLVGQRRTHGLASELEYQDAVGLVRQVQVDLERIDREFRQAGNALALLVGVADIAPYLPEFPNDRVVLVQALAPGTPSELIARRPDIRAAEHRLLARNASIGAARAAFFPRISLTGSFGSTSSELSGLFESGQRAWSFTPQLALPLFDAGRNRAQLDMAVARKDIAIAAYEQSIQTAFREVSDALAAIDTLRREEAAQRDVVQSSAATLRLSEARYRSGVDDHLRYLDAQRSHFANQMAWVEVRTQRQLALATLFRSLGGGWRNAPSEATAAAADTHGAGACVGSVALRSAGQCP